MASDTSRARRTSPLRNPNVAHVGFQKKWSAVNVFFSRYLCRPNFRFLDASGAPASKELWGTLCLQNCFPAPGSKVKGPNGQRQTETNTWHKEVSESTAPPAGAKDRKANQTPKPGPGRRRQRRLRTSRRRHARTAVWSRLCLPHVFWYPRLSDVVAPKVEFLI